MAVKYQMAQKEKFFNFQMIFQKLHIDYNVLSHLLETRNMVISPKSSLRSHNLFTFYRTSLGNQKRKNIVIQKTDLAKCFFINLICNHLMNQLTKVITTTSSKPCFPCIQQEGGVGQTHNQVHILVFYGYLAVSQVTSRD